MAIGAAIAGSAIVGAYSSNKASKAQSKASGQAADAQLQASRENIEFQKEVFDQQREDSAPWREAGSQALQQMQEGIASGAFTAGNFDFSADPGYQFRQQEGQNAIQSMNVARGRGLSGAQLKAATRFNQDLASQEYGNAYARDAGSKSNQFNQLASVAGVGQTALNADQNARQNMASSVGASTIGAGNAIAQNALNTGAARASAYQGTATAVNQGAQNYLLYNALKDRSIHG